MKRKAPTDKDLRLYTRLSDVDGDLILDSALPERNGAVITPKGDSRPSLWAVLLQPRNASVALAALLLTLTAVALLVTGITNGPQTEPPPHGTHTNTTPTDPIGSVKTPTAEDAAALRKGMSLSELVSLMGNDYTQEGTRYTFTLDTGEQLAVDTEYIYGGTVGSRITGFEWLGSAGKTYNPMGIPAEILQKVQEYATDTVIPVYAMNSLIGQYDSLTAPTLDEILKDAEVHYLRTGADGEIALLDGEGHGAGGYMQDEAFSFLEDVSALFDESVRVKAYYPILTASERGAVYFKTSIGDYILYLHGEAFALVPEGMGSTLADPIPYLMPASKFHRFAYGVVSDQDPDHGIDWTFSDNHMAVIEPYKMTAEGYRKPINIATPEVIEQITVGMDSLDVSGLLGGTSFFNLGGLYCFELTDGRIWCYYTERHNVRPSPGSSLVYMVSKVQDIFWLDSVEQIDSFGKPTLSSVELVQEGMSQSLVYILLGKPDSTDKGNTSRQIDTWNWIEDGYDCSCSISQRYEWLSEEDELLYFVVKSKQQGKVPCIE